MSDYQVGYFVGSLSSGLINRVLSKTLIKDDNAGSVHPLLTRRLRARRGGCRGIHPRIPQRLYEGVQGSHRASAHRSSSPLRRLMRASAGATLMGRRETSAAPSTMASRDSTTPEKRSSAS